MPDSPAIVLPIIGYRKNGKPIYVIQGGDGTTPPPPVVAPPATGEAAPAAAVVPPVNADVKIEDLPEAWQKEVSRLRAGEAKARTGVKEVETKAEAARQELLSKIAGALGLNKEGEKPDPEKLTQELQLQQQANKASKLEFDAFKAATKANANASALLDSRSFMDGLNKLDTDSDQFATELDKLITDAIQSNPLLRGAGQVPPRSGSQVTPGASNAAINSEDKIDLALLSRMGM
jgi:hypothetical protein